jgi:hypothetical protein
MTLYASFRSSAPCRTRIALNLKSPKSRGFGGQALVPNLVLERVCFG